MSHKRRLAQLEAQHDQRGYQSPLTDAERYEFIRGMFDRVKGQESPDQRQRTDELFRRAQEAIGL